MGFDTSVGVKGINSKIAEKKSAVNVWLSGKRIGDAAFKKAKDALEESGKKFAVMEFREGLLGKKLPRTIERMKVTEEIAEKEILRKAIGRIETRIELERAGLKTVKLLDAVLVLFGVTCFTFPFIASAIALPASPIPFFVITAMVVVFFSISKLLGKGNVSWSGKIEAKTQALDELKKELLGEETVKKD